MTYALKKWKVAATDKSHFTKLTLVTFVYAAEYLNVNTCYFCTQKYPATHMTADSAYEDTIMSCGDKPFMNHHEYL